jgi:hypothetical protein
LLTLETDEAAGGILVLRDTLSTDQTATTSTVLFQIVQNALLTEATLTNSVVSTRTDLSKLAMLRLRTLTVLESLTEHQITLWTSEDQCLMRTQSLTVLIPLQADKDLPKRTTVREGRERERERERETERVKGVGVDTERDPRAAWCGHLPALWRHPQPIQHKQDRPYPGEWPTGPW